MNGINVLYTLGLLYVAYFFNKDGTRVLQELLDSFEVARNAWRSELEDYWVE